MKILKKLSKAEWLIILLYFLFILVDLIIKNPIGISYSDKSYIDKVIYGTNIIPFQFEINTPLFTIIKNLLSKFIFLIPLSIVFTLKGSSFLRLSVVTVLLGFLVELLQIITFKGYFDTTDIILYWVGAIFIYFIIKYQKQLRKQ